MRARFARRPVAGLALRAVAATVALVTLASGLTVAAPPASAAAGDQVFWVATNGSVSNGLFGATAATVMSATNLNAQSGLYRTLATDGTYLYFSDGTNLVRTGTDGTGKTTVVAGVASPEGIAISGANLYYTLYNGGVYGVSLGSLPASPTQIFTAAGGGWNGLTISGSTIFAMNNNGSGAQGNQGLYSATLNGLSPVTATMIDASAAMTYRAGKIAAAGGQLYVSGSNGSIPVRDITAGTWSSINVGAATASGIYSVSVVSTTIYFSTSNGLIGSVGTDGAGATALTSSGQFTGSWSVAAAPPPSYTVTYNANGATSGSPPTDPSSPYASGSTVTVLGNTGALARTGYQFLRWNTAANGSGTSRIPGTTFSVSADTILYAQWTGGPLEFSESLSSWTPVTTVAFPSTAQGVASSVTVYLKNTASAGSFSTGNISTGAPSVQQTASCSNVTLAAGATCAMTLAWTPPNTNPLSATLQVTQSPLTDSLGLTGTVLSPARTPTFSTPVPTADGFTVNVTNYDSNWSWSPSVNAGAVSAGTSSGSTLPLTITGLAPGASSTVLVSTTRSGYVNGSASVASSALLAARMPTFSTPVPTADGFTVNVTNYDASWAWSPSVNVGAITAGTASGSTLPLTVTGLAAGNSATVTVEATRTGYVTGTGTVVGSATASGGGGSSSSEPTPTPTVPAPVLGAEPVPGGLPLGADRVTVGGTVVPVLVAPNTRNTGIDVSSTGWRLTLAARTATDQPAPLGPNGILRFVRGERLATEGTGFKPNSPVRIYLFSDPTLLGVLTTDSVGSFSGSVDLPPGVAIGDHVAQVNGYTTGNEVRSVSLGIEVVEPATVTTSVGTRVYFPYRSATLTPKARRTLRSLVSQVPADAATSSVVVGIVQAQEPRPGDRALARSRAAKVARFLKAAGMPGAVSVRTNSVMVKNVAEARRVVVTVRYTK